jgi:hypothetical protein
LLVRRKAMLRIAAGLVMIGMISLAGSESAGSKSTVYRHKKTQRILIQNVIPLANKDIDTIVKRSYYSRSGNQPSVEKVFHGRAAEVGTTVYDGAGHPTYLRLLYPLNKDSTVPMDKTINARITIQINKIFEKVCAMARRAMKRAEGRGWDPEQARLDFEMIQSDVLRIKISYLKDLYTGNDVHLYRDFLVSKERGIIGITDFLKRKELLGEVAGITGPRGWVASWSNDDKPRIYPHDQPNLPQLKTLVPWRRGE